MAFQHYLCDGRLVFRRKALRRNLLLSSKTQMEHDTLTRNEETMENRIKLIINIIYFRRTFSPIFVVASFVFGLSNLLKKDLSFIALLHVRWLCQWPIIMSCWTNNGVEKENNRRIYEYYRTICRICMASDMRDWTKFLLYIFSSNFLHLVSYIKIIIIIIYV